VASARRLPHTGLLWALEVLCWNRSLFPRAADALARLVRIDPGGRLGNRPIESLKNAMLGWVRHSGATVDDRMELLDGLLRQNRRCRLAASYRCLAGQPLRCHPATPTAYKGLDAGHTGVPWPEWGRFIDGLTDLALEHAGNSAERWRQLITRAQSLPPNNRGQLMRRPRFGCAGPHLDITRELSVWDALRRKSIAMSSIPLAVGRFRRKSLTCAKDCGGPRPRSDPPAVLSWLDGQRA
jgi:hypothetical protein